MNFIPHTQIELQNMDLQDDYEYTIEYMNKDYFNGEETLERTVAKCIINDEKILFIVPDPYGMDRFIDQVKVILQ